MIPAAAVGEYLDRKLDDHRWMKQLKRSELLDLLGDLRPKIRLHPDLRVSQLVAIYLGIAYPRFCYWMDMGSGKTAIILHLLQYWWDTKRLDRALIFVRSDKAFPTWEAQIKRWEIDIPFVTLDPSSSLEKWRIVDEFANGLIVLTYPGAVNMTSAKVKANGKKRKMVPVVKLVTKLRKSVDAVILDESTRAAGMGSLTYRLMLQLRKDAFCCHALAGRPFGRDPTMLWAQHHIVDDGETLGPTLGLFRAAFFQEKQNYFTKNKYVKDYKFDKQMQPELTRMLQHRSLAYDIDEITELPALLPLIEEVRLPEEAATYYARVVKSIIDAKGNLREMENAFMRFRQLSSGFLGFRDDETGERTEIEFEDNPKLDRLLELLDEMPVDRKALVFYEFTHSGRTITSEAKELGLNPIWLWSGNKNSRKDLARFMDPDSSCRVAVINNIVGAYSLDGLQVANYVHFFESPVSVIDREQAERRARRPGQKHKVVQTDLIVRGTMDQRILDYHKEGELLFRELVRDPARMLRGLTRR